MGSFSLYCTSTGSLACKPQLRQRPNWREDLSRSRTSPAPYSIPTRWAQLLSSQPYNRQQSSQLHRSPLGHLLHPQHPINRHPNPAPPPPPTPTQPPHPSQSSTPTPSTASSSPACSSPPNSQVTGSFPSPARPRSAGSRPASSSGSRSRCSSCWAGSSSGSWARSRLLRVRCGTPRRGRGCCLLGMG